MFKNLLKDLHTVVQSIDLTRTHIKQTNRLNMANNIIHYPRQDTSTNRT